MSKNNFKTRICQLSLVLLLMVNFNVKSQEDTDFIILEEGTSSRRTVNINAASGTENQNNKRGVFSLTTKNSTGQFQNCTATLVNTVNQNGNYYLLTAAHCTIPAEGSDVLLYLSVDHEIMKASSRSGLFVRQLATKFIGKIVMKMDEVDIALIEIDAKQLEEAPQGPDKRHKASEFSNLYFNGWSQEINTNPFALISHPKGDAKKTKSAPATATILDREIDPELPNLNFSYPVWVFDNVVDSDIHTGSSGGPVFNNDKKVIGVASYVHPANNPNKVFSSLFENGWYTGFEGERNLQDYLDPDKTYASQIPGGYGIESGHHAITDESKFNLQIPVGQKYETTGIGASGDMSGMIKLNLYQLNQLVKSIMATPNSLPILDEGGVYLETGSIKLKITAYKSSNNVVTPIVIYESDFDKDGRKSGDFELSASTGLKATQIRSSITGSILPTDLLNYKYNNTLSVQIEVSNTGDNIANVRALRIPALGYRNAVELFTPEQFKNLFKNKNYPENRALSSTAYLNAITVKVTDPGASKPNSKTYTTENNGGYVNLLQHKFYPMQSGSNQDPAGSEVSFTFKPVNTADIMHYSVWIDYNEDKQFTGGDENVLNISGAGNVDGSFTIPPNKTTNGTRIRIAMRKGSAPPTNGSGMYDTGEVEDYTVVIIPRNKNEEQVASSPSQVPIKEGDYYLEGLLEKGLKLGTNSEGQTTVNKVVTSDGTTTSYATLTPIHIKPTSANDGNQYIFSFDNNKQYLTVNNKSDYIQSTFDGRTLISKDFGTTKTETSLKVYSFTITEAGIEKTYYAFQDKDGDLYDIVMPYRLIPVSSSTTSSGTETSSVPLSASTSHGDVIGGVVGGAALLATGVLGYIYRKPLSVAADRFVRQTSKLIRKASKVSTCKGPVESVPLLETSL